MDSHQFLRTAEVFLLAAILIGVAGLGLIADPGSVAALSEFGVALMLFVIGPELSPQRNAVR